MIGYARRFKSETKKAHYYYRCNQRQKVRGSAEDCPNRKSYRAADLERRAWKIVAHTHYDPQGEFLRQLEEAYDGRKGELAAGSGARRAGLIEALAKIETRRDGFYGLAADNTMPRETLRRKLADLEEQERALRAELEKARDATRDLEALENAYAAAMEALTSGRVTVEEETTPEGRRTRYKRTGIAFTADSKGTLGAG